MRPCRTWTSLPARLAAPCLAIAALSGPTVAGVVAQVQDPATPAATLQGAASGKGAGKPIATDGGARARLLTLIDHAASRFGVERELVRAIVAAESAYNCRAVSRVGARGLMQLMPATAADYGVAQADDLFDPEINLAAGVRHLRRLLDKYANDYRRAIMAYNAGEGAVDRSGGEVIYAETVAYTKAVIRHYRSNGGVQPIDTAPYDGLAMPPSFSDPSAPQGRKPGKRVSSERRPVHCCDDLAEGKLDRVLRADRTDGDFSGPL